MHRGMNKAYFSLAGLGLLTALSSCADSETQPAAPLTQDAYWAALSSHCGKAFAGSLVSNDEADAEFADAEMVMHVRTCDEGKITVPFHVKINGEWDRSRTWVFTRNICGAEDGGSVTCGVYLKHDHRHEDGESDDVTMYGGFGTSEGSSAGSQDFPVDEFSVEMFEREGLTASVTNVWTVEVDAAETEAPQFAYQLKRTVEGGAPEDRFFRVEFDLSEEVYAPPPAWGWDD